MKYSVFPEIFSNGRKGGATAPSPSPKSTTGSSNSQDFRKLKDQTILCMPFSKFCPLLHCNPQTKLIATFCQTSHFLEIMCTPLYLDRFFTKILGIGF